MNDDLNSRISQTESCDVGLLGDGEASRYFSAELVSVSEISVKYDSWELKI